MKIPFNKPFIVGKELYNIALAVQNGHLSGDGDFSKKCCSWIESKIKSNKIMLVHSCTAALEIAAILCDIQAGDEFIVPSYTFVSTVNAFVLRGGVPVFVDISPDTMNMDVNLIEPLVTEKTKVIIPVHYAGIGCDMHKIMELAKRHNLFVVEDAAQGLLSAYDGKYLGTIGDIGCFSFHETKNFISGEGGAISINNKNFIERAEVIREKGTDRNKFFRGEIDKYTWVDIGSSYLASELTAAFLYAQLEEAEVITRKRKALWCKYNNDLKELEEKGFIRLPIIPHLCKHNAHMFYIVTKSLTERAKLIEFLNENGVKAIFHYIPLHTSPMGKLLCDNEVKLTFTENYSERILRLPLFFDLKNDDISIIVSLLKDFYLT